jgi:hypothetical protein
LSGEPEPPQTLARDFRTNAQHGVGVGTPREKISANLNAIRRLKEVEAQQREATPEDREALVKYTGWGAFPTMNCGNFSRVDLATRNENDSDQFAMQVGNRVFAGKGSREEAANALVGAVLSWRDDQTLQPRASFRGFEILSRGRGSALGQIKEDERRPEIFVRGKGLYSANLSVSNPVGTVQSIVHTLRGFDKMATEQRERVASLEKEISDHGVQSGRPFERERRLQELLQRQAELVQLLDLNKSDQQAVQPEPEPTSERESQSHCIAAIASPWTDAATAALRNFKGARLIPQWRR